MKWAEGTNQKQKRGLCVDINMQQALALVLQQNISIGDKRNPFFAFVSWEVMAAEGWRKGPWTAEEDRLLVEYVRLHGEGRWNSVATLAGLKRNGKSCRLRWVNYLRPDLKKGQITPYEETIILELHARWGNRWSTIARSLPGRTDNEIKNYWRTHFNKKPKPSSSGTHKAKAPRLLRRQQLQQQQQQLQQEQQNQQQMMLMMNQIMDMKLMSLVVEEDNQIAEEEGGLWRSMLSAGWAAAAVPEGTSNHIEENLILWDGLWD